MVVINRLDDYSYSQDQSSLKSRLQAVLVFVDSRVSDAAGGQPVVDSANQVDPTVAAALSDPSFLTPVANQVALADVSIQLGTLIPIGTGEDRIEASPNGHFVGTMSAPAPQGQQRESTTFVPEPPVLGARTAAGWGYALEVQLVDPYTFRATTIANVTGLLLVVGIIGLALSVVVATFLASRFSTPLRRLSEAAARIGEGDLASRVPLDAASAGSAEIGELSRRFNAMAARLEESVEIIRRDRDRSREFLADVSHELRTPIAAMRTFIELLQGPAGADPATRAEFLESTASQLGRLDWLSQNLLELSKLDSGLVLLDVRPDDLRATVESAAEQVEPSADRHGVELVVSLPDRPIRIGHDPQRIGQVVANLVGNAVKFTPRGGSVHVSASGSREGATIEVRDTGPGIPADELPHIFERFYRGTTSGEVRSSGSGLGLAIVKSIVDMHGGRISVDSALGVGSTFRVSLPRDPRPVGTAAVPRAPGTGATQVAGAGDARDPQPAPHATPDAPERPTTAALADGGR